MFEGLLIFVGMCVGGAIVWLWKRPIQKAKETLEVELAKRKGK